MIVVMVMFYCVGFCFTKLFCLAFLFSCNFHLFVFYVHLTPLVLQEEYSGSIRYTLRQNFCPVGC